MCGGSSASTDRGKTLEGYGDLEKSYSDLLNFGTKSAGKADVLTSAGAADTGKAADYYGKMLEGGPAALQAASPEISALTKGAEQQKKSITQTGNRTGGTNEEAQKLTADTRGKVADVLSQKRDVAGGALADIGKGETGAGVAQGVQALGAKEGASSTAANLTSISAQSRATSQQIHDAAVAQWAELAAALIVA